MSNRVRTGSLFGIPLTERILFAKHLAMMVKSGMTEVESLKLIRRQIKSGTFGAVLDTVIAEVENGQFLSEALYPFRSQFGGELFVNVIKLGEMSGTLPSNLEYLAKEIEKDRELRSKVRSALVYPVIVLLATLGVTGTLVFFILPKILPIFTSLNIALPLTTRILVGVSEFLINEYLWIMLFVAGVAVLFTALKRVAKFNYLLDRLTLKVPLIGAITLGYNIATLTRTLALLLKSGTKIVEAVGVTARVMPSLVYRNALQNAAEEINRGGALHKSFEAQASIIPTTATHMIEVGERTGNLDANLLYLSEFYEKEVDANVRNLSSVLEPALLVIMGLLVGFVAIAIITPIYEVTQTLGR